MRYSKTSQKQAQENGQHDAEQASERMDGAFKMNDNGGNGPSVEQVI
jgi:hypothetical protein